MVDLVSISLVKSLGISPCTKTTHQHVEPSLEGVGQTRPKTYGFYHLRVRITDRWNCPLEFIRPFLAVDRDARDSQLLLGRPSLKDFRISVLNGQDAWEFEKKPKVTKISSHQFHKEIQALPTTQRVFSVCPTFVPPEKSFGRQPKDENEPLDDSYDDETEDIDLSNVPKRLRHRFRDFFDARNTSRLASHRATDHTIELKPGTEPPYMRTYNMLIREVG
jgi:hypothetical protein